MLTAMKITRVVDFLGRRGRRLHSWLKRGACIVTMAGVFAIVHQASAQGSIFFEPYYDPGSLPPVAVYYVDPSLTNIDGSVLLSLSTTNFFLPGTLTNFIPPGSFTNFVAPANTFVIGSGGYNV